MATAVVEAVPDDLCDFLEEFGSGGNDAWTTATAAAADDGEGGFRPVPHEADVCAEDWTATAARSLAHNGFCALRSSAGESLVPAALCERCRAAADQRLEKLLACARARGLNPRREKLLFRDVCSRTAGGLRYDMRLPWHAADDTGRAALGSASLADADGEAAAAWVALRDAAEQWAAPVLRASGLMRAEADDAEARGDADAHEIDSIGCVTSLPGAPDQHFHPDGTARGLVNCFVPLLDVSAENGSTELRPGSHCWEDSPWGPVQRWDERTTQPVAPALHAGELLLFDFRVLHRGRANHSGAPRQVGYVLFARRGVHDTHNFAAEYDTLLRDEAGEAAACCEVGSGHTSTPC